MINCFLPPPLRGCLGGGGGSGRGEGEEASSKVILMKTYKVFMNKYSQKVRHKKNSIDLILTSYVYKE